MIHVQNLTKYYGNFIGIEDVSFKIERRELVGFLGPNGAGKTTTMRILTCFLPPTSGHASVAGYDVFKKSLEVRKHIGYLPENVPLYLEMTVSAYLRFMAKIRGVPGQKIKKRVETVTEQCGLVEMRRRIIGHLSKGYRQRVGLAQALVHDPEVLILDEPTVGLDPKQVVEIRELIKQLAQEHTIILSTHILPEASMICNRVIVINSGRIAGTATLDSGRVVSVQSDSGDYSQDVSNGREINLTARGAADRLREIILSIDDITACKIRSESNGIADLIVRARGGADIQERIAAEIVNNGCGLIEIRPVEMSLEDVFLKLISQERDREVMA